VRATTGNGSQWPVVLVVPMAVLVGLDCG